MSAPESVRTKDGITWTLRTVTSSGIALYAPKGVCECPAFVMATLAELAEHGIQSAELAAAVAEHGAFPMPVGPVPPVDADRAKAPWGRDGDGRPLLGPGAHWTDVPEVVDQELARIQGRVDEAQSGHWYVASDTEAWRPAGTVRTNVDGYQRTVGQCTNMRPADLALVLHAHDDLSWCLEMLAKSRARVAELEAEHAGQGDGCSCPPTDPPHQVGCPLDGVGRGVEFAVQYPNSETVMKETVSRDRRRAEASLRAHREVDAVMWRDCRVVQRAAPDGPWVEAAPDAVTQPFAPVAALREVLDGEPYAYVHHEHRTPHDLPELGGAL